MPYATYKLLHLIGLVLVLVGLGAALAAAKGGQGRKVGMLFHGLGLLVMLVAGFGLQAKANLGMPLWLWAKIGLWVVLAFLPVFVRRGIIGVTGALLLAGATAGGAVWLVLAKPF